MSLYLPHNLLYSLSWCSSHCIVGIEFIRPSSRLLVLVLPNNIFIQIWAATEQIIALLNRLLLAAGKYAVLHYRPDHFFTNVALRRLCHTYASAFWVSMLLRTADEFIAGHDSSSSFGQCSRITSHRSSMPRLFVWLKREPQCCVDFDFDFNFNWQLGLKQWVSVQQATVMHCVTYVIVLKTLKSF